MISFFANRGEFKAVSAITFIFTARIGRMGKVMFSQVSVRSQVRGVPQSQVLSQVSGPRSFPRGNPSPGWGGTPVLTRGEGYPRTEYPPGQDRTGVPPSWDSATLPAGTGYPPPPVPQDRTAERVIAECLLRSRRRTFLSFG